MKKNKDPKRNAVVTAPPTSPATALPIRDIATLGGEVCHIRCRSAEFFVGDNGMMSMTRLLCFMSFFPASYVVMQTNNADTLGWYLGAYVLSYIGGKATDVYGLKPTKPTINAPRADSVNVKTSDGDINVR